MNASLTNLVNSVYTLTNRPDLVGETLLAVKSATLKAHQSDFYYKDLFETGIELGYSQAQQIVEYRTLVPRWRALSYLRKFDASSTPGVPLQFLKVLTPTDVLDSYSVNKENVCYIAGIELHIRCSEAQQYFLLGCYVHPVITDSGYSSWIADESPATIFYEAAATIFKTTGFDEQASAYKNMVQEQYAELKLNNILANGY